MCDIVAVRGRQAAGEVVARLTALEPDIPRLLAVAELGGDRALRAPRPVEWTAAPRGLPQSEIPAPGGRLAIGRAMSSSHGPGTASRPLTDCSGGVILVHCGTIDNAASLRAELETTGHRFTLADDSEVIPHAVEDELNHGAGAFEAFRAAVLRLSGSWAIAALIARHNSIFIARYRSPLLVRGTVGRCVAASDPAATEGVRGPLRVLEDGSIAELGTMWRWGGTPGRPPAPLHTEDVGSLMTPSSAQDHVHRRDTLQHH